MGTHQRQRRCSFLRTVSGDLACLSVSETQTVGELRQTVGDRDAVDAADLRLSANGVELADSQLVGECLNDNSTLEAMLRLVGGGKKRKKKNYLKPKRIKHKHKNVAQGKVMRLRTECKHPMCGPGIFMANHFDRYYCGKCFETYKLDKAEE